MNKKTHLVAVAGLSLAMSGCFSSSSNPDRGTQSAVQVSGVAVDGYVVGARVYADLNRNGRRDGFEPMARTDRFGFFSYRPEIRDPDTQALIAEARDYCEVGPERYCLRVSTTESTFPVVIEGGYDRFTGLPFEGFLRRYYAAPRHDSRETLAITPFTTLTSVPMPGLGDYWGDHTSGSFEPEQVVSAVTIHSLMSALTKRIRDAMDNADVRDLFIMNRLYHAVSQALGAGSSLQDQWSQLEESQLLAQFQLFLDDLAQTYNVVSLPTAAELAEFIAESQASVDGLSPAGSRAAAERLAISIIALVEAESAAQGGAALAQAQAQGLVDALADVDGLRGVDTRALIDALVAGFDPENDDIGPLVYTAQSPSFGDLSGQQLSVEKSFAGQQARLTLYFATGDEAGRGGMSLCLAGDLEAVDLSDFTTSEDGKVLIRGEWSSATPDFMLLTLSALGGAFEDSASLRLRSASTPANWQITFEYDQREDDFVVPDIAQALTPISGEAPANVAACPDL